MLDTLYKPWSCGLNGSALHDRWRRRGPWTRFGSIVFAFKVDFKPTASWPHVQLMGKRKVVSHLGQKCRSLPFFWSRLSMSDSTLNGRKYLASMQGILSSRYGIQWMKHIKEVAPEWEEGINNAVSMHCGCCCSGWPMWPWTRLCWNKFCFIRMLYWDETDDNIT